MNAFTVHRGRAALLPRANVDTDQIIPKQFLARVARSGYGPFLFFDWRYGPGTECVLDKETGDFTFAKIVPAADFPLNDSKFVGATILVANNNFGCGSSREHAVWALQQYGFVAVIAPTVGDVPAFADIFRNNSYKNGLLPVELSAAEVDHIFTELQAHPDTEITIDLHHEHVILHLADGAESFAFNIPQGTRTKLLAGLDDIGLTLTNEPDISAFEQKHSDLIFI